MKEQPVGPRCGKWLPVSGQKCGRPLGHKGKHMTPATVRRMYDRSLAYHAQRREKRRRQIDAIKLRKGCTDCGYKAHACALDFDHLPDQVKISDISSMMGHAWAKVAEELAKCEVRCKNCAVVRRAAQCRG